jgi:hypothetical protein
VVRSAGDYEQKPACRCERNEDASGLGFRRLERVVVRVSIGECPSEEGAVGGRSKRLASPPSYAVPSLLFHPTHYCHTTYGTSAARDRCTLHHVDNEKCSTPKVSLISTRDTRDIGSPVHSSAALSGSIIVKVGSEEKKYLVHKALLSHHSGYFRGALSSSFKETDNGVIPLDDVDTEVFDVFVNWIYKDQLPECVKQHTPVSVACFDPDAQTKMSVRHRTYVLADRLLVPQLKRVLLEVTYGDYVRSSRPSFGLVFYLFNNLSEGDKILQLLIDAHCIRGGVDNYRKHAPMRHLEMLPARFMVGVMHKLQDLSRLERKDWLLRIEDYTDKLTEGTVEK